jgi:hypothetical protein
MTAFNIDKRQCQSFTGSYQAFSEPPTCQVKKVVVIRSKGERHEMYLLDMCVYNLSYIFTTFEKGEYKISASKIDKPQFQSVSIISWQLSGVWLATCQVNRVAVISSEGENKMHLLDICMYKLSYFCTTFERGNY